MYWLVPVLFVVHTEVWEPSSSLQHWGPCKTQWPPAFLGARLWQTLCPFFCSFVCFLFPPFSLPHPTLPRSTESRSCFHWRVFTFPLSHRRLVGSPHKERAANGRRPLRNLGQCPRPSYLHRDRTSQSGVRTGEDFDPSTQWLWKV